MQAAVLANHQGRLNTAIVRNQIGIAASWLEHCPEGAAVAQSQEESPQSFLCWNGRMHNRQEWIEGLGNRHLRFSSDAEVALSAYSHMDEDWIGDLVGDFCLALWDARARKLVLARDAIGTRMLYYHEDARHVTWATSVDTIRAVATVSDDLDSTYIATYLIDQPLLDRTPYAQIRAVPPGHAVVFERCSTTTKRLWSIDHLKTIFYKSDDEYEEHFRHLFREAVRCRMRGKQEVWAELSGGLDSSSVVCMADDILAAGEAETAGLRTLSYTFERSRTSDETKFIARVEAHRGKAGYHVSEDDQEILRGLGTRKRSSIPCLLDCMPGREKKLQAAMQENGAVVLLSGHGGDQLLWSTAKATPELADLLVQGKLLSLAEALQRWSATSKLHLLGMIWYGAIQPALPWGLGPAPLPADALPRWINHDLVKQADLHERILGPRDPFGFKLPSKRRQITQLLGGIVTTASGTYQDMNCIELAYPLQDRRLIEFVMAIPFQQLLRPGENRSIQRRALARILPDPIVRRKGKKGLAEPILRAISTEWKFLETTLQDAEVFRKGFVDRNALCDALARARMGESHTPILVLSLVALEWWLRLASHGMPTEEEMVLSSTAH